MPLGCLHSNKPTSRRSYTAVDTANRTWSSVGTYDNITSKRCTKLSLLLLSTFGSSSCSRFERFGFIFAVFVRTYVVSSKRNHGEYREPSLHVSVRKIIRISRIESPAPGLRRYYNFATSVFSALVP